MTNVTCNTHTKGLGKVKSGASLIVRIRTWIALSGQRRALRKLDASRLHDIGLTAKQANQEAKRPFWDAPSHWMR